MQQVRLPNRPFVVLIPGAVRAALLFQRVVVPLLFLLLLFGSLVVGCHLRAAIAFDLRLISAAGEKINGIASSLILPASIVWSKQKSRLRVGFVPKYLGSNRGYEHSSKIKAANQSRQARRRARSDKGRFVY